MELFKKILIANRGEIAVRIIRACRELGIKTVAVYSEADKESLHVKLADEAICIGPASPAQSYLNLTAILSAADITDAEAIHPGYGFLSENAQFAEACVNSGIVFIGPTPENIKIGGDKAKARQILKRKGIPVVPGSDGPVKDEESCMKIIKKIGLPIIFKASAGGGGRGMRIVNDEKDIEQAFFMAQREALAAFGNGELYIEKYFPKVRHIEVQILADKQGNIIHLGERDCTIQRRHQKLLEEAPSPVLNEKLRKKIGEYAVKAAKALKFRNIGTFEFIVDDELNPYFIEINTRVQVEHPVTEEITDIDIIKEQIKLAKGYPLSFKQPQIKFRGHAIECRINAEDPEKFIPSPGTVEFIHFPGGPGIRVDSYLYQGCKVSPYYDSLVAKIIAKGANRQEAIDRMKRALQETAIKGIQTNISLFLRVLENPDFIKGKFFTDFIQLMNNNNKS
ncbi:MULTISPECIES: acetyl-CoA carboxylase biotin carboxylase subunit [Thermodesulfovibrio]|jgi:acetyl-CoA carboxylase biotin carboxylase subunit|uniref:Biotin carboxylase n=2 Tax=Thermodesulfovibrio TaxID=28261 RepID=A0A2J6WIS8_9BACT|nr:MAG: acetyl-CoA carboxylase biotin carboxylase subunit [Thermodesulfovibrio aggregans]